jgi:hypothetical protein
MLRARVFISFMLLDAATGRVVEAQAQPTAFVDVSFGPSVRGGAESIKGEYYHRSSGWGLVSLGGQPAIDRSLIVALRGGFLGLPSWGDDCRLTPTGGCYQEFPFAGVIALTAGVRRSALEMTVGPSFSGRFENGSSFGLLAAGRIGTPPGSYFSIGLAFYGIVTTIEGTPVPAGGLGINVRSW